MDHTNQSEQNTVQMNSYYLASTNDHTDRTQEIEAMLSAYGACCLGTGVYYVRGVRMPDHFSLTGMGPRTKIVLCANVQEGFAVRIGSFCCVKDLTVAGAEAEIALPERVGNRHGILFSGSVFASMPTISVTDNPHVKISDCFTRDGEELRI